MNEKKFESSLEKQLELFRTATEWSDLVAYLTGLEGILKVNKYSRIPKVHLLYKRLNQCLNPALPAGVHMKALGVYKIVISKISQENLSKEIGILSLGLFTFYSHSNLTSIPNYIEVVKKIVEALGTKSEKICKSLIFGVIMGLEEENTEQYHMTMEVINMLEAQLGKSHILKTVWRVMGECTDLVPGCLAYIVKAEGERHRMKREPYLLSRGFVSGLKVKDTITIRKSFDLYYAYRAEGIFVQTDENQIDVSVGILSLFLMKEISLVKRIQAWITEVMKEEGGLEGIFNALCKVFSDSVTSYFKILVGIRQNVEESRVILKESIVWALRIIEQNEEPEIKAFFKVIDARIVWEIFTTAPVEIDLIDKAIQHGLLDEQAQTDELPLVVSNCIRGGIYPYKWIGMTKPSAEGYRRIWEAAEERIEESPEEDLLITDLFLSIGLGEEIREIYTEAVGKILRIITGYWKSIRIDRSVHYTIIEIMKKIGIKIDITEIECNLLYNSAAECPEVFWAYDEIVGRRLQDVLIDRILYRNGQIRNLLEDASGLRLAFYLCENYSTDQLNSKFVCFLVSFCESHSYSVRKRAQSVCDRIGDPGGVVLSIFRYLNDLSERKVGEKIVLFGCDYYRILFGLQILKNMIKYSGTFRSYLKKKKHEKNEILDLNEQFIKTKNNENISTELFLLVLMYCTSEYAEREECAQECIAEIEEMSINILQSFFTFNLFGDASVTFKENFVYKLIDRSITTQNIINSIRIAALMDLEAYDECVCMKYIESKSLRKPLIEYCIKEKQHRLLMELVQVICKLIENNEQNEMAHLEYILQHSFNLTRKENRLCAKLYSDKNIRSNEKTGLIRKSKNTKSFFVVSSKEIIHSEEGKAQIEIYPGESTDECICGTAYGHITDENMILTLIDLLFDLFIGIDTKIQLEKETGMKIKHKNNIKVLQEYFTSIFKLFSQLLSEGMILKYSKVEHIRLIRAIEPEIELDLFSLVLRVTCSHNGCKYKLLREWICVAEDVSLFDSFQIFGAISMILAQAKTKKMDRDLLWFFAAFFEGTQAKEGVDLGEKGIELCNIFGYRLGFKKMAEVSEISEKSLEISELLKITESIILSAVSKNCMLDLSNTWTSLILPCYKLPYDHPLHRQSLVASKALVQMPEIRQWKKDFYEYMLTDKFFKDTLEHVRYKAEIESFLVDSDKIVDLLSRATNTGFFIRDSDIVLKVSLIKRLRFMILCAPFGEYGQNAPGIFSFLSEVFSGSSNVYPSLIIEAFSLCQALCIKIPVDMLINMWPIAISEAIGALSSEKTAKSEVEVGCAALLFLDLVASLDYPETVEFTWLVERLPELIFTEYSAYDEIERDLYSGEKEIRIPCRPRLDPLTRDSLNAAVVSVSIHHKKQKHYTRTDSRVVVDLLISDFPEI